MFNFLKKRIVKIATVIEEDRLEATKKLQELEEERKKERDSKIKLGKEYYDYLLNAIVEFLNPYIETLEKAPKEFTVGERVIVNKYNLKYNSHNPWDLGASALCGNHYRFRDSHHGPIYAKITKIYVDTSWTYEMVEKFLDSLGYSWMGYGDGPLTPDLHLSIGKRFRSWLDSRGRTGSSAITNELGLYVGVKFELEDIDFNPQWGLNIHSFLKVDSEEGKKTKHVWEIEENLHNLKLEYEANKDELELLKSAII